MLRFVSCEHCSRSFCTAVPPTPLPPPRTPPSWLPRAGAGAAAWKLGDGYGLARGGWGMPAGALFAGLAVLAVMLWQTHQQGPQPEPNRDCCPNCGRRTRV